MPFKYILKKAGIALLTVAMASVMTFCLLRAMPGDAVYNLARTMAQEKGIEFEEAKRLVTQMINYDPDEPILQQMGRYYGGLARGNLGTSFVYQTKTVNEIIAYAMPWTLFVVTIALLLSFFLGSKLGGLAGYKRKSFLNPIISVYSTITSAVPDYIFAILFQILFCFALGWFPMNGAYDVMVTPGFNLPFFGSVLYHATLPILTFVITRMGMWALSMKGNTTSVLGEDYITAAYARGLHERTIRRKYINKNAMLPLLTTLAVTFGTMVGGATLIENTFVYPGMGQYLGTATGQRDYTVMQGILLVIAIAIVLANFCVEIIYSKLDPRIKEEG